MAAFRTNYDERSLTPEEAEAYTQAAEMAHAKMITPRWLDSAAEFANLRQEAAIGGEAESAGYRSAVTNALREAATDGALSTEVAGEQWFMAAIPNAALQAGISHCRATSCEIDGVLAAFLAWLCGSSDGTARIPVRDLAAVFNRSPPTTHAALKRVKAAGTVRFEQHGETASPVFSIELVPAHAYADAGMLLEIYGATAGLRKWSPAAIVPSQHTIFDASIDAIIPAERNNSENDPQAIVPVARNNSKSCSVEIVRVDRNNSPGGGEAQPKLFGAAKNNSSRAGTTAGLSDCDQPVSPASLDVAGNRPTDFLGGRGPIVGIEFPAALLNAMDLGTAPAGANNMLDTINSELRRGTPGRNINRALFKAVGKSIEQAGGQLPTPSAMFRLAGQYVLNASALENEPEPYAKPVAKPNSRDPYARASQYSVPIPDDLPSAAGEWID